MKYHVTIGDRTILVDLSGTQPTVDGEVVRAELATIPGTALRHLLLAERSIPLVATPGGAPGRWRLLIEGRTLDADVLDERTRLLREMTGGTVDDVARVVVAPMPGLVVRVNVRVDQEIEAGHGVIVIEAMKMENELRAPAAGRVARIEVAPGQAVDKGAVLVVLE